MIEIQINVNAPELSDAINNLATAISNLTRKEKAYVEKAPTTELIEKTMPDVAEVVQNTPAENIAEATPLAEVKAPSEKTAPQRKVTLDELSRAGAALIDTGKMQELVLLLKEYEVQAITQLDPGLYPVFAEKLEALGAKF